MRRAEKMPNRIPKPGQRWMGQERVEAIHWQNEGSRDGGIAVGWLQDKWYQPKQPPWPPYWVSQLLPNWFIHTDKSNLICKLHTTQFRGEVTVDLHLRSQRVNWPLLCTAIAKWSLKSVSCWRIDAPGGTVEMPEWKQTEMTWFIASHASVLESNNSASG